MEGGEAVSVWLWKEHSMMLRTMIMMLSSPCVCLRLCGSEGFSFLLRTHFFFLLFLPSPFSLLWVYFLFLSIFSFRFSGFASTHDDPGCRGRARRMNTSTTPALVGLESMIPAKGDQNKKKMQVRILIFMWCVCWSLSIYASSIRGAAMSQLHFSYDACRNNVHIHVPLVEETCGTR